MEHPPPGSAEFAKRVQMVIDHIGVVVKDLDQGLDLWRKVFSYVQTTQPVENARQSVRVVFLEKAGSSRIKLVAPTGPSSPVAAMAARGGGLHHLCFNAPDMGAALNQIERAGGRITVRPQSGEAFMNEPIAFAYLGGLLLEIISTGKKALSL